ncbi:MAG: DegV family EDD domain-containing protein [Oscillospiraceae bacterium]|nr:DegV family EDD domain-containing protein [Oscillospiraceae bacterium]
MEKKDIMIAADSVCDLPDNIIEQYDIALIYHYVNTVAGKFLDREEITSDNIVDYFEKTSRGFDTLPPSVNDYEEFYKKCLKKSNKIIHVVMTKGSSKSYVNACDAAKKFDNVFVVNSKNVSVGYGMVVMKGAELCRTGMSAEKIVSELEEYREQIHFRFVMRSLENLHRCGRCPASVVELTNFFKIHVDIRLKNDRMQVGRAYFGKMPWVYNQFVKTVFSSKNVDTSAVFVVTSGCTGKFIDGLRGQMAKYYKFDNTFVTKASSTVSCNCGAGAVGIAYASFSVK